MAPQSLPSVEHTFDFASRSNGVIIPQLPYRKTWPVNLFQMSKLTFDHCFKVKCDHHMKKILYLLYYWFQGFWK